MRFLFDTNVISELRKKQCNTNVRRWINAREDSNFFISVVTLYEIRRGICAQEKTNPVFACALSIWLQSLREGFCGRILHITEEIAEVWARISFAVHNTRADNIISATAKVYDLIVVTRNIRHFQATGVACVNPWNA